MTTPMILLIVGSSLLVWLAGILAFFYLCGLLSGRYEQRAIHKVGQWSYERGGTREQKWANFYDGVRWAAFVWPLPFVLVVPVGLLGGIGYYGLRAANNLFDEADETGKKIERRRYEMAQSNRKELS